MGGRKATLRRRQLQQKNSQYVEPHKHKTQSKSFLNKFIFDEDGEAVCIKKPTENGYMAEHEDRYTCGKTGETIFKLNEDEERLPVPENFT